MWSGSLLAGDQNAGGRADCLRGVLDAPTGHAAVGSLPAESKGQRERSLCQLKI